MPGYFGMTPWGLYHPTAGLIGAAGQVGASRRPLSPSGNEINPQGSQYQVIPAYYDQNGGIVMGRGGTPLRLISPSSILLNSPGTNFFYHFPHFALASFFSASLEYIGVWRVLNQEKHVTQFLSICLRNGRLWGQSTIRPCSCV